MTSGHGDGPIDTGRSVPRAATSFRMRRRRLSPMRQHQFERRLARHGLAERGGVLDLPGVDGGDRPVVLDVGVGHGESTIVMAAAEPGFDVIAIEVHDPGVAAVLDAIERVPLPNVRVVHGDVLPFLDRVPPAALHGVRVFFPDPWPKTRQQHRRLLGADTVAAFADRLRVGGFLHVATDNTDYATAVERMCDEERRLHGGRIDRPASRPLTRFEQRGIDAGREIVDLCYVRAQLDVAATIRSASKASSERPRPAAQAPGRRRQSRPWT
jgi:tRNA (guanine-N7-)-methyltransferase